MKIGLSDRCKTGLPVRRTMHKRLDLLHTTAFFLSLWLISVVFVKECSSLYLPGKDAVIESISNAIDPSGKYSFGFKTSHGIERDEQGFFDENGKWIVKGIVSWIAPDNKIYGYKYTADEDGYQQEDMVPQDGDVRVDPKTKKGLLGGAV